MSREQLSRRSLTAGAAWSIPAITVAAAAPAIAASHPSTPPDISRAFYITRSSGGGSGVLTVQSNNDGASYYKVVNATASTTVTNVYASVLVSVSGLKFTTSTGNWSDVKQDTQTSSVNGVTYYRYFASLLKPVPTPIGGVITLPNLSWTSASTTALANAVWVNGRGTLTLNGVAKIQVGSYRSV